MEIIIHDHVLRTNLIYYDRLMVHQYSGGLDKNSLYIFYRYYGHILLTTINTNSTLCFALQTLKS